MGSKSASPHTPLSPPPPPTSPYTPLCGKFPNFKALFPAVSMEIHELVLGKTLKKNVVGSIVNANEAACGVDSESAKTWPLQLKESENVTLFLPEIHRDGRTAIHEISSRI